MENLEWAKDYLTRQGCEIQEQQMTPVDVTIYFVTYHGHELLKGNQRELFIFAHGVETGRDLIF